MFVSTGHLVYYTDWAVVYIDGGISDFYRSLIPKAKYVHTQAYPAHITVVRKGVESPDKTYWNKYRDSSISFTYNGYIENDNLYYWIDAWSNDIGDIREELNLARYRGSFTSYHITLGNIKANLTRRIA